VIDMLFATHAAAGVFAGAVVMRTMEADPALLPWGLLMGAGAAMLPDLDHPGSTAGQRAPVASRLISAAFGHRTATHSLLAAAAFTLALKLIWPSIPPPLLWSAAAGYVSHLAADSLTNEGAMWLWPLRFSPALPKILPRPMRGLFVTGGPLERHVVAPALWIGIGWALMPMLLEFLKKGA